MDKTTILLKKISSPESWLDNICRHTKVEGYEASHIGRVKNFSDYFQSQWSKQLYSTLFSTAANDDIAWSLELTERYKPDYLVMTLSPSYTPGPEYGLRAKYKLIIYDDTMNEAIVVDKSYTFYNRYPQLSQDVCSRSEIVSTDKKILSHDEFIFRCEVQYLVNDGTTVVRKSRDSEIMNLKCHCFNILKGMYEKQKFIDVKININSQTFEAHKAILAAASPVFLAMFENNMTETERNYINIDDVDEETFEEMLRFIYTGEVNDIENVAYTLFAAADKYAIDKLKNICQEQLYKSLTVDNAVRILILSDLHSAVELKEKVIKFIKIEQVDVTEPEDFDLMVDSHRDLLAEVIRALTKN